MQQSSSYIGADHEQGLDVHEIPWNLFVFASAANSTAALPQFQPYTCSGRIRWYPLFVLLPKEGGDYLKCFVNADCSL